MKRKQKKILLGILIVGLLAFALAYNQGWRPFVVGDETLSGKGEGVNLNELELENCFSIDSCKNMLIREGMQENFLENLIIQCENSKCFLRQK